MNVSKPASRSRPGAAARAAEAEPRPASIDPTRAAALAGPSVEHRILDAAKVGVPIAVLAVTGLVGSMLGPAPAVLVLASGALIGVIAVFWASLRTLLGETPLTGADAYALGAPRTEEEQKQAVIRAIKDLEFERSVGKISDEDYRELVAQYRAEAKRLLRILDADAQPRRAQVEALVARRLERAGISRDVGAPDDPDEKEDEDGEAEVDDRAGAEERAEQDVPASRDRACSSCGTVNDEDAVFCKKCGARQPRDTVTEDEDDAIGDDDADDTDDTDDDRPRDAGGST